MTAIISEPADRRFTKSPALDFEVVRPQSLCPIAPRPRLKKSQIAKLIYAMVLLVLRSICHDLNWNRLAHKISVHKFDLFPELRRWQIDKWVGQFQRQNLFPDAAEPELREWAKELVMEFMI